MDALYVELLNVAVGILTILLGFATKYLATYLNSKGILAKLETNKELVDIVVKAVEQTYKSLDGDKKFDLAKKELVKMMNEKKIKVSEKEIDIMIEALVKEMKESTKEVKDFSSDLKSE